MFYLFTRRDLPGPGAQAFALATQGQPKADLLGGGTPFTYCFRPMEGPLASFVQKQGVQGLGGIQTGSLRLQPLVNLQTDGISAGNYVNGAEGY